MAHLSARLPARCLATALAFSAPALALGQDSGEPFEASGEILLRVTGGASSSAAYSPARVVGPVVSMSRRDDGTWTGDLLGVTLDLHSEGARAEKSELKVSGNGLTLVQRPARDGAEFEGQLKGIRFRAEVGAKKLTARFGNCSLEAVKKGNAYRGEVACLQPGSRMPETGRVVVELIGDALEQAPFPQLALAFLAVLPQ